MNCTIIFMTKKLNLFLILTEMSYIPITQIKVFILLNKYFNKLIDKLYNLKFQCQRID